MMHASCKGCKWLKVNNCNADGTRGGGKCSQPHKIDCWGNMRGRYFSSPRCKYYEKENEMNNEEMKNLEMALIELENVVNLIDKEVDKVAEKVGATDEVCQNPEPEGTPKNIYGIGEVLYLPVVVKGVRENALGKILYEVSTADDKRIGFKIYESIGDIWRDKNGYCASVPESVLVDKFEKEVKA